MLNTQCAAVATVLRYDDRTAVPVHQCGRPSSPMKNTLPEVAGSGASIGARETGGPSGGTSAERRSPFLVAPTSYGVASRRLAAPSASQNSATSWAAVLVRASGTVATLAASAGAVTTAEPSTLKPMPNAISARLKVDLRPVVGEPAAQDGRRTSRSSDCSGR